MQIALPEEFLLDNPRLPRIASKPQLEALYEPYGTRRVKFRIVTASALALTNVYQSLMEVDRYNQFQATRLLEDNGALEYVTRAVAARPAGAILPDYYDLAFLYSSVRALQPKRLIELGSGLSTVVMLKALQDNGGGKLQVYEFSDDWLEMTRQNLYALFGERSAPSWISISQYREDVPDDADCVYLDGAPPGSKFMGGELLRTISARVVLVDGRLDALGYIEKRLSPKKSFSIEIELAESEQSSTPIHLVPLMNACFYF